MKELTEKQKEILDYITDNMVYVPPTYRNVAKHFNMTVKGAYDHISAIKKKGYLTQVTKRRRDCIINNKDIKKCLV